MSDTVQQRTILLADDDAVSRQIIINFLSRNGYGIITAKTGFQAILTFQKENIDLILMDLLMPEMDGFTAVEVIRENEKSKNKRVPIIAVTACAIKGDKEKCIAAGMDDYMSKPIDLVKLLEVVDRWLK